MGSYQYSGPKLGKIFDNSKKTKKKIHISEIFPIYSRKMSPLSLFKKNSDAVHYKPFH